MATRLQALSFGKSILPFVLSLGLAGCGGEADGGDDTGGTGGMSGTQCEPGAVYDDGCNSCSCLDGALVCTERACIDACQDGETKTADDGCNTCSCTNNSWACTKKACQATACGAMLGDTCSESEYCAYSQGSYCGAADATATCQLRPEACDAIYDPVCGCDGNTYSSDCVAASAGTGVFEKGECQ